MATKYSVYGVRISAGEHTQEGFFNTEDDALRCLDELANDDDCLLAEVEYLPDVSAFPKVSTIAQSERINGEWKRVSGDLRTRSRAAEARDILATARGS